ncbi:NAD-dependent epimerase/dehydratase family protein [Luedemannella flava]
MVFVSTCAVYGSGHAGALSEDLPAIPESPYAASKLAAEQLVAFLGDAGAIVGVTLRCFNIAGAYSGIVDPNPTRIISAALRAAAGEIPHVSVNGDGSAVREFTHVLDVARAVGLALGIARVGGPRLLNVGTGVGVSMMDVIRAAEKVTGRHIEVVHRPRVNEPAALVADVSRIRSALGWSPTGSALEDVLRATWEAGYGRGA